MHIPHFVPRSIRLVALVLALALMGSACSDSYEESVGSPDENIFERDFVVPVTNDSDRCAWVTVYAGSDIATGGDADPRFVGPNQVHTFKNGTLASSRLSKLEVRTEIIPGRNCSSTVVVDHTWEEAEAQQQQRTFYNIHLCGVNGDYFLFESDACPSGPRGKMIDFANVSDRCAWVTIYWESCPDFICPWHIATGLDAGPRFVPPGQRHLFQGGDLIPREDGVNGLKVRTEIMPGTNCSSTVVNDQEREYPAPWPGEAEFPAKALLCGKNGAYFLGNGSCT